ncbi:MAG: hypothetical protein U9N33_02800 [Campylobacterota bacterium]|nr:hypothetical protein [Campylobacterota bacterium]
MSEIELYKSECLEFKNEVLEMKQIDDKKFDCIFLGSKTTYSSSADYFQKNWNDTKDKRLRAYELVPDGCKVMSRKYAPILDGLFIGGVLEDSVQIVYGLGERGSGIRGYSCSLFFFPTKEVIDSFTNYSSLHGKIRIKDAVVEKETL